MKRPDLSSDPYPRKHVGSFCVIFFLAVFRPAAIWPEVPVSSAPLAVLAAWLLLFYKIQNTVGYRAFLTQHKTLLLLIAGYFVLCGLSLVVNHYRYPDLASLVRWGLTFPIIQSALVACGFLFSLPLNKTGMSISRHPASGLLILFIAGLIPTVALWQKIDNESAYWLYQYTVAGDMGNVADVTRSILATSTDLGAVSAIIAMGALVLAVQAARYQRWLLFILLTVTFSLNAVAGTSSGSRGFILAMGAGLATLFYQFLGGRTKLIIIWALPLLLAAFLILLFGHERLLYTLSTLSPFFAAFAIGIAPARQDFVLNQVGTVLGDRADLWSRAIAEITTNPWLGISNGGYRLLNESLGGTPIDNVHNAYLQLGVDAGLPGLILGAMAMLALLKYAKGTMQTAIYATIFVGLIVDNFLDHSLAWVAIASCVASSTKNTAHMLFSVHHKPRQHMTAAAVTSIALSCILVIQYQNKRGAYNTMELTRQVSTFGQYFFSGYWNSAPTLITSAMDMELRRQGEARSIGITALYPSIETSSYCTYAYPNAKLLSLENEVVATSNSRVIGGSWRLSYAVPVTTECGLRDASQLANWISNYHLYYGERLRTPNADILLEHDYISFFSPIFTASTDQVLTLSLNTNALESLPPTLVVHYYDAATGAEVSRTKHPVDTGISRLSFKLPLAPSGKGFLKLKLETWHYDREKNLRSQVRIKAIGLINSP